jgi:signal transduction histidine kinase
LHSEKVRDPEVIEKLRYLERDASRAVDEVRRYSHDLRPTVLEHLGLQAALEQIVEDANKLKQVAVDLQVSGKEPKLAEAVKLGLFRIAQESLSNCRKHARAMNANICLTFQDNNIEMIVTDNGIGFDVEEASSRSSLKGNLGLMSIRERAELIGAELEINSVLGKGTAVVTRVKL